MLKRMISLVLCMTMVFSLLPVGAFATEEAETEATEEISAPIIEETEPAEQTQPTEAPPVTEMEAVEPDMLEPEPTEETAGQDEAFVVEISELDSEELLLGYLDPMYQSGSISFFGTLARERLSGADKVAYDALKARIELLAAGKVDSTSLTISFDGTGYKASEVNLSHVQEALLHDCPYEMYWYRGYGYMPDSDPLFVVMLPSVYYQAEGFDINEAPYMDKIKAHRAANSAKKISTILTKYETSDTYDKLAGYADEICALVTYDYDAANNNTFDTNINPWTLINVFDGDSSTNVVCEGYAEAFQYLCEMTNTFDESVECYSVTGNDHKWNIVRINGVSYLMDVTHCDVLVAGDRAYRGPKFLGGGQGSVTGGYYIDDFNYKYYDEMLTLWGSGDDSILKLSSTKYTPPVKYTVAYDANGGTGAPGSQSKKEGSSLTLSSTVPVRAGHEFLGWALSEDAQDAQYQPGDTYSADSDVMLYAVWKDISCGPDLIWAFDGESGVLTISGTGAMNAVPSAEYTPWYVHRNEIKTVVVKEGVTALGACAFAECENLEEVQLPQTLTAIGPDAFYNCGSLGSISLPDGLTTIGHSAFYNCSSLQSVLLPEGVQSLEENTFGWCLKLTYVALPSGLTAVDKNVFYLCSALNHVFYGGTAAQREQLSITSTGNSAFKNAVWHCDADGTEVEMRNDCEGSGLACSICGEFIIRESNGTGEHSYADDLDLSCDVCGHVRSVQAISLMAVPTQTKYDIFTGTLDVSGGRVQLTYSDGGVVTVDLNEEMVTGFDNTLLGTQRVTVSWGGCDTGFDVEILPGTPDSLDIISPAKKNLYALEDALDLTGLLLSASYEGYGVVDIPLIYAEVSPVDMTTPGEKMVTLTVGGVSVSYPIQVQSMCLVPVETANYPESKHDYDANTDETQILTVPGAYRLTVTFSHETATEAGADFLYVYDGEENQVAVYSGTQASGKSVVVSGDTVKLRLTSNDSGNTYGYSISTVEATMTDHVFGDWEIASDATCVDAGLRSRTCLGRNCSYTETETIPATGEHSYTDGVCIHCGDKQTSGICGDNLMWSFEPSTGTLIISGHGEMYDYIDISMNTVIDPPWKVWSENILNVEIEAGVLNVGDYAFSGFESIQQISLPESLSAIGDGSFGGCSSLTNVLLPLSLREVGIASFANCKKITDLILPDGVSVIPENAFAFMSSLDSIYFSETLSVIESYAFVGCDKLNELIIPKSVETIETLAFCGCTGISSVVFEGDVPNIGEEAFYDVVVEAYYPMDNPTWTTAVMQDYGGDITWVPYGTVENRVMLDDATFDGLDTVWIDGVEMDIQAEDGLRYVDLSNADAQVMTVYEFDVVGTADDGVEAHARYPVGMKVWTLENVNGFYTATRQTEFDNILQYVGCSVRVTGKNGIRMITAMEEGKKKSLTGTGLAGYTLKEYGTAIAWASRLSESKPLVLGKSYVKSNYAYKKGVADPVYRYQDGLIQYTNVLVNFSMEQCKKDIAMRPYMILTDGEEEIVLYGGIVERSIGYIACQNRNTFKSDMDAYKYIWDIIHAVYGDRFDEEYAPEWTPSEE